MPKVSAPLRRQDGQTLMALANDLEGRAQRLQQRDPEGCRRHQVEDLKSAARIISKVGLSIRSGISDR